MTKYLRDRKTGDLYGWNFEMAKLPYMQEVEDSDDDFTADNTGPDPDYVDPETGFPVAAPLDEAKATATEAALAAAIAKGKAELTTSSVEAVEPAPVDDEAQYDEEGHMLLGYTEDDEPVFETDDERDARMTAE